MFQDLDGHLACGIAQIFVVDGEGEQAMVLGVFITFRLLDIPLWLRY